MRLTRYDRDEAIKMLESGQTITAIAKHFNVKRDTIYRNILNNKINENKC